MLLWICLALTITGLRGHRENFGAYSVTSGNNEKKPPIKAKIVSLDRKNLPEEVVTQKLLEDAQVAEWEAGRRAALLAEEVRTALARGARLEEGRLYFDADLRMVRSRKAREA